jgi:peptidoglycan/xylan/chitin deacetylase (PgdA/CDA1 family)
MEIGSHGCAHVRWTELNDAEIAHDVARSIERLSAIINAPVRSVAIPFGSCDRRVLSVLRALGVGKVYSSFRGQNDDEAWLVRRECIMAGMSYEDIYSRITYSPTFAETALNFLKIWRRAGNAALWAA